MSAQLRAMANEGLRLTVYDDATGRPIVRGSVVSGNPTIGYGCLLSAPGGIDATEAEYLFQRRWAAAGNAASTIPGYGTLGATRQGVLTEMVYQMGIGAVKQFTGMISAIQRADFSTAAREMLASKWASQTPSRARQLADLMEHGDDAA